MFLSTYYIEWEYILNIKNQYVVLVVHFKTMTLLDNSSKIFLLMMVTFLIPNQDIDRMV